MRTLFQQQNRTDTNRAGLLRTLCFALLAGISIPAAKAGCGDPSGLTGPLEFPDGSGYAEALHRDARAVEFDRQNGTGPASIVGMWKFQVVSKGNAAHNPPIPDGAVIDGGFSQWHSDGNEFSTSAPHSPASGNICMGVWRTTAPGTYQLNHFALTFDPTSGAFNGTVQIHQTLTLSPGGTLYAGTYIIDVYDVKANHVDHIGGQVTATRITLDSTVTVN